ncbi:MAG: succinate-semialdehyde dehydrogenase / glutarate-semialdehyde dehydrogenase [Actinomycetota bacterium]|jgi:succinate-semialdehyde dehydrogenase/glutarate-semialdehyde dehydrogenase|nr:succinate-semialdehyde dehydrogenase / glutarate-semialdehyde dehydrogenase [Actinomycetota bacterium]
MAIATVNPATGETLKTFEPLSDAELRERIGRASAAFTSYRLTSFDERAGWMNAAADLLDQDTEQLAQLMTTEMGKPLKAAKAEVTKCASGCRYYAAHAAEFLADQPADADAVKAAEAYSRYQPLGPVLAVMPWNFPLWQAMRFAAPALMAGNVGLLKHASNVPQTALYMEDLFRRAGFPADVFQTLLVETKQVELVLSDELVAAATLTGSTPAGRSVASIGGQHLKKTVLELGGSDPFVVMPSADLATAAEVAVTSRVQNNGQSCIAAKRFLVHQDVAPEWTTMFVGRMKALVVGDPMDDATDIGPLATETGREDLAALVDDAVAKGATVLCGGTSCDGPGWFYPATVLVDVDESMEIWTEEAFGPVAVVRTFADIDEALRLANDSQFGLGSNFWTADADEQERFIRDAEAGIVTINGMTTSYPELPFGGVKNSGYGRELSAQGIREFCNLKAVWRGP